MKPLAILKTGDSFPELVRSEGDFEDWIIRDLGLPRSGVRVFDARRDEVPDVGELSRVVITGSPEMLTESAPWMLDAERWVQRVEQEEVPILGICFGHQLVARALGGTVGLQPGGREIGTIPITLSAAGRQDPLLGGLPTTFPVQSSHFESVLALPPGAIELASSPRQPCHAFRVGKSTWGVQFHPEFTAHVTRAYLEKRRPRLEDEGLDVNALLAEVIESPAAALLQRFARWTDT